MADQQIAEMCACGQPLHYSSAMIESQVRALIQRLGPEIPVTTSTGVYWVQRHFIALHGLRADDLPALAERGIVRRAETQA